MDMSHRSNAQVLGSHTHVTHRKLTWAASRLAGNTDLIMEYGGRTTILA